MFTIILLLVIATLALVIWHQRLTINRIDLARISTAGRMLSFVEKSLDYRHQRDEARKELALARRTIVANMELHARQSKDMGWLLEKADAR